ncbi:MAG: hypothetical protein LBD99_06455 [Candidatus Margulisbacteria bacterium]|jgi:hypothetical protein|nr:hypothetical protein [Candidatus Margulisiibacteriota bacterium]
MLAKSIAQAELSFDREEIRIPDELRARLFYEKNHLYEEACKAFGSFAPPKDAEYKKAQPFETHPFAGGAFLTILASRLNKTAYLLYQLNKEAVFPPQFRQKNQDIRLLANATAAEITQVIPKIFQIYNTELKGDFLNGFTENDTVYFNLLQHLQIIQNTKEIFRWLRDLLNIPKS